jgi:hypothetical protein
VTVSSAFASIFPSPLNSPPVSVTVAPLKLAVGSDFTLTAASAIDDIAAVASSAAPVSHMDFRIMRRDFLIVIPFAH